MAAYSNVTLVADTGDVTPYLGENIDATYDVTMQDDVGMDAEAYIVAATRYDWVANLATVDTNTKRLLSEYVARWIAVTGIAFNMAGFTSRIEAEDMLNVHIFRLNRIEKILVDQKTVTYMK